MNKIISVIAVSGLLLASLACWVVFGQRVLPHSFGAAGNMLIENYIPYVLYNGGINTAKDLTVSGSTAFSGTVANSGAVTNTSSWTLGSSGTALTRINSGTCYILAYATTIAATSTALVDCQATALIYNVNNLRAAALTGVTFGDPTVASLSTTTATTAGTTFGGLVLEAAMASTTAGYIQLQISNLTGATFTWPVTGAATGTATYIVAK